MELFEEALQKWEQALNIRHQTQSNSSSVNSLVQQGAALTVKSTPDQYSGFNASLEYATVLQQEYIWMTMNNVTT